MPSSLLPLLLSGSPPAGGGSGSYTDSSLTYADPGHTYTGAPISTPVPSSAPLYQLLVDWDLDGTFQDATVNLLASPAPKAFRGIDQVRPLETIRAGTLDVELWNGPGSAGGSASGMYSPGNASSPLYGKLLAGPRMRLQCTYQGATYPITTDYLDDLVLHPNPTQQSVSLQGLGPLYLLRQQGNATQPAPISTPLYENITTDQAVGYILDAIGFPAGQRNLATGNTVLRWWWVDNQDAFTALQQVVNTEGPGCRLYEDASGNIVFENRWYRWTQTRSLTSQFSFQPFTEPVHMPPFTPDASTKDVVNVATVTSTVRSLKAVSTVWTNQAGAISLMPGETRPFIATSSDPFMNAITPAAGTDYTVTTGSVTSLVLDRTSGASCTISITAGPSGATITGLQLRAQLASVDSNTDITSRYDTSASQARFHERLYPLQIQQEVDAAVLQDSCDGICLWYQNPINRGQLTIFASGAPQRMLAALTAEVSDRVTVVENQSAIDGPYWIEALEHDINGGGFEHMLTVSVEEVLSYQPFKLDSSPLDSQAVLWW